MDRSRSLARALATAAAAVALLSGCSIAGEDATVGAAGATSPAPTAREIDEGAGALPTREPQEPAGRVDPRKGGLDVAFGEFAITLEASAIRPGPVTFVIRNGGALVHGFEIEAEDDDGDSSGPGNGELKLEGPAFGPNEVVRIRANLAPGTYEIECFVAEHDDRGMRTTLLVSPDAPLVVPDDPSVSTPGEVRIADFAFVPEEVHVSSGTELTWANADPAAHTVTADDGSFDSGTLDPGEDFVFGFDRAGSFPYACLIHPTMRGTVHVA